MSEARRKAVPARSARGRRHWSVRVLGWLLGLFFVGVIGTVGTFFVGYQLSDIPDPNKAFATNTTSVYYADGNATLGRFFEQNRRSVPLSQIPKTVQDAVVAAEDRSFWTNPGISPSGMARAAFNIARGQQLQGGSTITQQYVKVMYLTQERTFTRKFSELFIATKLSRQTDKKEILEGYLNTIYFGEGAYGVAAAGDAYFTQPDPRKLTVPQAALLATVLNNPTRFDVDNKSKATQALILDRYRYVLDGMRITGTITDAQYEQYAKALPALKKKPRSNVYQGSQGFLLDMARRELGRLGFSADEISGGGLRVRTTFDLKLQQAAVKAVFSDKQPAGPDKLHVGLASVRPQTGELVALVGGPDYLKSQLNWATSRARPGSSFKPFAVAAALKDGVSLRDRFEGNSPIEIRGEEFGNEFGEDYGRVSLLQATEQSVNTAFYDLVDQQMEDGPQKLAATAEAMGIPKIPDADRDAPAMVLGPNAYASPMEMAGAYGTLAAEGQHTPVHVISEVKDKDGTVLWSDDDKLKTTTALDPEVAKLTTSALQEVVEGDKGSGKAARDLDRPAAGKTGTAGGISVEHRRFNDRCEKADFELDGKRCKLFGTDADTLTSWWVGYTPQLSTAVVYRAGKEGESDLDDFADTRAFFGGGYPAETWVEYMKPALEGQPVEDFGRPEEDEGQDQSAEDTPSDEPTFTPQDTPTADRPSRTPPRSSASTPDETPTGRPSNRPTETPPRPPITLPTRQPGDPDIPNEGRPGGLFSPDRP